MFDLKTEILSSKDNLYILRLNFNTRNIYFEISTDTTIFYSGTYGFKEEDGQGEFDQFKSYLKKIIFEIENPTKPFIEDFNNWDKRLY